MDPTLGDEYISRAVHRHSRCRRNSDNGDGFDHVDPLHSRTLREVRRPVCLERDLEHWSKGRSHGTGRASTKHVAIPVAGQHRTAVSHGGSVARQGSVFRNGQEVTISARAQLHGEVLARPQNSHAAVAVFGYVDVPGRIYRNARGIGELRFGRWPAIPLRSSL